MIYIILGTIVVVGFTNFTGMGLSLGRTKLLYNNFEIEDEYKEKVPEYIPPEETPVIVNLTKTDTYNDINMSEGFNNLEHNNVMQEQSMFSSQASTLHTPMSTLQAPDTFGSGDDLFNNSDFSTLTPNEQEVLRDTKPVSKFESKFQSTEATVYEEWQDDSVMPDFSTGFGDLDSGNYNTEDLISSLAGGGLNYVHG